MNNWNYLKLFESEKCEKNGQEVIYKLQYFILSMLIGLKKKHVESRHSTKLLRGLKTNLQNVLQNLGPAEPTEPKASFLKK